MKVTSLSIMLFFSVGIIYGQATIEGKWKDHIGGGVILIYEENGKYFGQLIAADLPEENKKIQGKEIVLLKNFVLKSEARFCCGTIYQPREKRLVNADLILVDENTLRVDGRYMGFTRSRTWRRI